MPDIPQIPTTADREAAASHARRRRFFRSRRFRAATALFVTVIASVTAIVTRGNSHSDGGKTTPSVACTPSTPQAEPGTVALDPYGPLQSSVRAQIQEFAPPEYQGGALSETHTTRRYASRTAPLWAGLGVNHRADGSSALSANGRVNPGLCVDDHISSLTLTANGDPIANSTQCSQLPRGSVSIVASWHVTDGRTVVAELVNNSAADCELVASLNGQQTDHLLSVPRLRHAQARLRPGSREITMQIVGAGSKPDQVTVSYETGAGASRRIELGDCKTVSLKTEQLSDGWQAALTIEVPSSVMHNGALLMVRPGRGLFGASDERTPAQSAQFLLSPGAQTMTRTDVPFGVSWQDLAKSMASGPDPALAPAH